jgi:hypothetical protein
MGRTTPLESYELRRADELHLLSKYPQLTPRLALAQENLYAAPCSGVECSCSGWHLERIKENGSVIVP